MKTLEETLGAWSADWVRDGLISEAQRAALIARHPVPEAGSTRFVAILATVGGLLFAVGVSLVIKSNWAALGDWTKIAGVVALMAGSYATGWKLKTGEGRYGKIGDAFLMCGGLLFLGGIALVSQVFHLNARPATGVLVWWLGIAAVPWLTRAKGAQFLSIVAGLVWLGMEMTTRGSWLEVDAHGGGYGHDDLVIEAVFVMLGLALWLAGLALRAGRWAEFAGLHEKWGIVVASGALYAIGFARHVWRAGAEFSFSASSWLALTVGIAAAAVALACAWRVRRDEVRSLAPWLAIAVVAAVGAATGRGFAGDGWLWSAAAWVALFVLSVAVVRSGLATGREGWVNLGIASIALNILTRYFDLFGTMLEGGVFFIAAGVVVIGLGIFLERKRRALLAGLREEARA